MTEAVVLITGATAGIGRATALAFAPERARLVCSGRNAAAGARLLAELRALGAEAEFMAADVSSEDQVHRLVEHSIERFSTAPRRQPPRLRGVGRPGRRTAGLLPAQERPQRR